MFVWMSFASNSSNSYNIQHYIYLLYVSVVYILTVCKCSIYTYCM